jgi:hypothetical protein
MIKIAALTAAVFLIAWAVSLVVAYKAGRKAQGMSDSGVQAKLHRDMVRFIRNAVDGTGLDSDYWASLSPKTLEQGEALIERYRSSTNR